MKLQGVEVLKVGEFNLRSNIQSNEPSTGEEKKMTAGRVELMKTSEGENDQRIAVRVNRN